MLLKVYNRALIRSREQTFLTVAGVAADTALTVASTDLAPDALSSNTWANNDYMLVGEFGAEGSEIMQMSAAVTSATSLTVDREGSAGGLRHAHPIGTPVYRLDFNRVEFSRNTTDSITGSSVLATVNLQPDDDFTLYQDTTNTTGYGFARFNNATSGAFSSYTDGVNYETTSASGTRDPRTLYAMRQRVRRLLDELDPDSKLDDDMIADALNDRQRDLAHIRLWSFYENERSFSAVANQFAYTIPATVQLVHGVKFETQPLNFISKAEWDLRHFDTDSSSADPMDYTIWNGEIWVRPRPSTAAGTTTLNAALSATATSMTVVATTAFLRGDFYRVIIDTEVIYATASTATTLTGLVRGAEGTTAASHTNTTTVTERDIVYSVHVEPTDLLDTQDRTAVPEPDILSYGAAIDLAPFVGKEKLITTWELKYQTKLKTLEEKYSSKQTVQFSRIKNQEERLQNWGYLSDPNRYPQSLTGT